MKPLRRFLSRQRGVTLVELLVTVAIMTLIASVVGFAVIQIHIGEQKKVAPTFARLSADKVIDRESGANDPWGCPYVITCGDDDVTVVSPGPDRRAGTADDIVSPPDVKVASSP